MFKVNIKDTRSMCSRGKELTLEHNMDWKFRYNAYFTETKLMRMLGESFQDNFCSRKVAVLCFLA